MKTMFPALAAASVLALGLGGCATFASATHTDPATLRAQVQAGLTTADVALQIAHQVAEKAIADGAVKADDVPKVRKALAEADAALSAARAAAVVGDDASTAEKTAAVVKAAFEIEQLFVKPAGQPSS